MEPQVSQIPIQNIYYLLCYAWADLTKKEIIDVKAQDNHQVVNLLAQILINGTQYILRRGLDRSYLEQEEDTSSLRGKILFSSTSSNVKYLLPP